MSSCSDFANCKFSPHPLPRARIAFRVGYVTLNNALLGDLHESGIETFVLWPPGQTPADVRLRLREPARVQKCLTKSITNCINRLVGAIRPFVVGQSLLDTPHVGIH